MYYRRTVLKKLTLIIKCKYSTPLIPNCTTEHHTDQVVSMSIIRFIFVRAVFMLFSHFLIFACILPSSLCTVHFSSLLHQSYMVHPLQPCTLQYWNFTRSLVQTQACCFCTNRHYITNICTAAVSIYLEVVRLSSKDKRAD